MTADIDPVAFRDQWDAGTISEAETALADGRPLPTEMHELLRTINGYEVVQLPTGENVVLFDQRVRVAVKAGWAHLIEDGNGVKVWTLTEAGEDALVHSWANARAAVGMQSSSVWAQISPDWAAVWNAFLVEFRTRPWATAAQVVGGFGLVAAALYALSLLAEHYR